jgi:hypothetical protein
MHWLRGSHFDHASRPMHEPYPILAITPSLSSPSALQREKSWVIRSQSSKASKIGGLHQESHSLTHPDPSHTALLRFSLISLPEASKTGMGGPLMEFFSPHNALMYPPTQMYLLYFLFLERGTMLVLPALIPTVT